MQNIFDQQFYRVLNYEEKIQKTFQIMDQAVYQKVEFISLLKNKQIDVLNLVKKVTELRKIQLKVRNNINELSIINSSNKDLVSLQICYLETLSFQEKDLIIDLDLSYLNEIHLSQIDTQLIKQKLKIRQAYAKRFQNKQIDDSYNPYQDFNLFSKQSCVIYAQIEQNYNLSIKKVSSSFLQVFGITQQDAQDKRVEILMPPNTNLINQHRQYIVSYFQNQNNNVCYLKKKNLFGYQQQGFIFPIKVDVRLNYSNGLNQIGLTAYIQRIYDENDYILFQSDSLNVIGATQNILKNVFLKNNIEIQKQSDLGQFFPFLYKLKQDKKAKLQQQQKEFQEIQDFETKKVNSLKELLSQKSINQKYTKILDEHNFEKFKLHNQEYMLIIQNFQSSNQVKNQVKLQNISFSLVEISINDCEYKDVDNLYYMKISKIKPVQPELNSSIILKYLKEYQEFYTQVFTKNTLETLQTELEYKFLKMDSLEKSNFNFQLNQQNTIQSQFNQNQQNCQKCLEENKFSENKSQDFDNSNENNTLTPTKSKQQRINTINNNSIYKIQEENSQLATNSEQKSQIYPQNKQNDAYLQVEIPDQSNTYYHSPRDIFSQNFRSQQDFISLQQIRDSYNENEEIKYGIPLTSNRKETNRELLSEVNLYSQANINSPKQNFDENLLFQNVKQGNLNNNDKNGQIQTIVSLKLINQGGYKNEQIQVQQLQSTQEITSLKMIDNAHQINSQQRFYQDQDILSQNLLNVNETKETTYKFQMKKMKKRNKQRNKEDQLENNSSSVSRESSSSTKKRLIKTIKKQTSLSAIKIVILFGVLTYLALSILTIQQYFNFINSVDFMNQNLNSQNWPFEIQIVISRSLKNLNIIHTERQNNFTFPSQADHNKFDAQLINQLQQSQQQFMSLIQTMDQSVKGKMLYDRISVYNSSFYVNQIYNPSNLTKAPSKRTTFNFEQKNSSLLYSIIFINYYIYQQSINPTGKLQEVCILQNLQDILLGVKDTQNYFQNYQSQQVKQIQDSLSLQIGVILAISAICLLSSLPLYSYIQKRKDKTIQLFCTFPVSQLQNIIIKIRQSYYQNKVMNPHIKNIPIEIQMLNYKSQQESQNHKKQTLSQITKLPHFSYSLLIAIFISYILLSFYPIFNRIFVQKYLDNLDNNLMMLEYLNTARSYIIYSSGIISFGFDMKVFPSSRIVQLSDYIPEMQSIMSQTNSLLTNLTIVSNQFNLNRRYKQQSFDNFFFPLFEDDMCDLISNNSYYTQNSTVFKPQLCKTIYNGFLQKGLKLSIKQFSQKLQELYAIIQIKDEKIQVKAVQEIFKTFNIEDYSNLIDYLDEIIKIMKYFLLSNCSEYYQYLKEVQLILIIYQLILIAFIFGFCWYAFSSVLAQQITKFKHHLQVMNVYHLLENNFILSFVKNNIKL
ncbi:transmembrane protein, putative (macronuclear) [Tetrahymena thermophila SB210]|uniref:Transmembrane protein, putative n=1 Tax=Tetrahymena thermophila (strain SB210) TaxID=312017 RepID=Q24F12_TETTS|nr:transmembrane protein, putative [Tetrahymena thermophila SB210]EAS06395.2 transmembrane protein, putative [Tetrahymena thermophila SB210]|eukprot:XP_001026640.2 transmembrane protein, putative [Tetrahymena thermophila SB210]